MESQKGRSSAQGVAPLPGEIYSFVQNVASRSILSVLSVEKHGAIIMGRTASSVPPAERG